MSFIIKLNVSADFVYQNTQENPEKSLRKIVEKLEAIFYFIIYNGYFTFKINWIL